jgi:hypothetical protein
MQPSGQERGKDADPLNLSYLSFDSVRHEYKSRRWTPPATQASPGDCVGVLAAKLGVARMGKFVTSGVGESWNCRGTGPQCLRSISRLLWGRYRVTTMWSHGCD